MSVIKTSKEELHAQLQRMADNFLPTAGNKKLSAYEKFFGYLKEHRLQKIALCSLEGGLDNTPFLFLGTALISANKKFIDTARAYLQQCCAQTCVTGCPTPASQKAFIFQCENAVRYHIEPLMHPRLGVFEALDGIARGLTALARGEIFLTPIVQQDFIEEMAAHYANLKKWEKPEDADLAEFSEACIETLGALLKRWDQSDRKRITKRNIISDIEAIIPADIPLKENVQGQILSIVLRSFNRFYEAYGPANNYAYAR